MKREYEEDDDEEEDEDEEIHFEDGDDEDCYEDTCVEEAYPGVRNVGLLGKGSRQIRKDKNGWKFPFRTLIPAPRVNRNNNLFLYFLDSTPLGWKFPFIFYLLYFEGFPKVVKTLSYVTRGAH